LRDDVIGARERAAPIVSAVGPGVRVRIISQLLAVNAAPAPYGTRRSTQPDGVAGASGRLLETLANSFARNDGNVRCW
jgi:hypothetical protein